MAHNHKLLTAVIAARHSDTDLVTALKLTLGPMTDEEVFGEMICTIGGLVHLVNDLARLVPEADEAINRANRETALQEYLDEG